MKAAGHAQYAGIQMLRFAAALLVVVCHATLVLSEQGTHWQGGVWQKGGVGVTVFFVISGFVIVVSAEPLRARADGWKVFAQRRGVRIVPLYWIATTLKLLAVLVVPAATLHSGLNWPHVLLSYVLLPSRNPLGEITPLHAVGWTLILEAFFYVVYGAALYSRTAPIRFVLAVFAVLILWGVLDPAFSRSWSAMLYTRPVILEFALGMVIAAGVVRGVRLPPAVGAGLVVLGAALIAHFDVVDGWSAFFCHGLPAAAIVSGVVSMEPWLARIPWRWPVLWGEASYALYLFHPFALTLVAAALVHAGYVGGTTAAIALMTVASVIVGLAAHRALEVPMTAILKRALTPRTWPAASPSLPSGR